MNNICVQMSLADSSTGLDTDSDVVTRHDICGKTKIQGNCTEKKI